MRKLALLLAVAVVAGGAAAQGSTNGGLDPGSFVAGIDNPYWPMPVGSTWTYRETDGDGDVQRVVVKVTDRTKTILGIDATVVHDVVTQDGKLKEDTWDWYAQDRRGNVWYLGEDTKEYENGKVVGTAGSWEAGVDGAQAGIVLPAHPRVGMTYRQEHYPGHAEDRAKVLSLDEWAQVKAGFYRPLLMTKDWTPLEPRVLEHKFYARGVGPVLVISLSGSGGREELVQHTR
jgi:hypothetical protein